MLDVSMSDGGSWWFSSMPADATDGRRPAVAGPAARGRWAGDAAVAVTTTSRPATWSARSVPRPRRSRLRRLVRPRRTADARDTRGDRSGVPPPLVAAGRPPLEGDARGSPSTFCRHRHGPVTSAEVTVDGPEKVWYVSVEPNVDGLAVSGLTASVSVGSKGAIVIRLGLPRPPDRLGDYPVLDTRAAIDRLTRQVVPATRRSTASRSSSRRATPATVTSRRGRHRRGLLAARRRTVRRGRLAARGQRPAAAAGPGRLVDRPAPGPEPASVIAGPGTPPDGSTAGVDLGPASPAPRASRRCYRSSAASRSRRAAPPSPRLGSSPIAPQPIRCAGTRTPVPGRARVATCRGGQGRSSSIGASCSRHSPTGSTASSSACAARARLARGRRRRGPARDPPGPARGRRQLHRRPRPAWPASASAPSASSSPRR